MSEVVAEIVWKRDSPFGWSHASGWTIGRYIVSGVLRFVRWQGSKPQGPFDSLGDALKQRALVTKA